MTRSSRSPPRAFLAALGLFAVGAVLSYLAWLGIFVAGSPERVPVAFWSAVLAPSIIFTLFAGRLLVCWQQVVAFGLMASMMRRALELSGLLLQFPGPAQSDASLDPVAFWTWMLAAEALWWTCVVGLGRFSTRVFPPAASMTSSG